MRLCGIYRDCIPLTCYIEKKNYNDLYKGYQLQEEIFETRLSRCMESRPTIAWMAEQKFFEDKIPKAKMVCKQGGKFVGTVTRVENEDDGMSMSEFIKNMCSVQAMPVARVVSSSLTPDGNEHHHHDDAMNEKEFQRLVVLFKKWASPHESTKIARFMQQGLDPLKKYTAVEIKALCKEYRIQLKHLMGPGIKKSNLNYGVVLEKSPEGTYSLHSRLSDAFHEHF
jgi:hypothetical protein